MRRYRQPWLSRPWLLPAAPLQALRVVWCCIVLLVERAVFHRAARRCGAHMQQSASFDVLVLADPQIIDRGTYEEASTVWLSVARHFSDAYLRKVWLALTGRGLGASLFGTGSLPDLVVFLGDVTDRGRWYKEKSTWDAAHARWARIYDRIQVLQNATHEPLRPRTVRQRRDAIPALVMPGNHDIGLPAPATGGPRAEHRSAYTWFLERFGVAVDRSTHTIAASGAPESVPSWNVRVPVSTSRDASTAATHELVLLNAQELVGMQPLGTAAPAGLHPERGPDTAAAVEQLGLATRNSSGRIAAPRILFSHVPLARGAQEHSCEVPARSAVHGVRRESHRAGVPGGDILQGGGIFSTYQNLLQDGVSSWLLERVQPALIFSGDDHDHCESVHRSWRVATMTHGSVAGFSPYDVPELTVKSVSMLEGVHRPGFARLRLLAPPVDRLKQPMLDYTPCLLPDQVGLWLWAYVPFLIATLAYLAGRSIVTARGKEDGDLLPSYTLQSRAPRRSLLQFSTATPPAPARRSATMRCARHMARELALAGIVPLILWIFLQTA